MSMENLNYDNEIWKDIPEYEGLYQVSNLGRVKSLERFRKGKNDSSLPINEKIKKLVISRNGYYRVILFKESIGKWHLIHRLVYEAFNGSIPEGLQVNHLNEIKSDNRLENLNLMTPKENTNFGTGIERRVKKQINGKKSKAVLKFDLNNNLLKEYPSIRQVERETGFANQNIVKCCKGKYEQAYGFKWKYK